MSFTSVTKCRDWLILQNQAGEVMVPFDKVVCIETITSLPCAPGLLTSVTLESGQFIYVKDSVEEIKKAVTKLV